MALSWNSRTKIGQIDNSINLFNKVFTEEPLAYEEGEAKKHRSSNQRKK
jgi:hypothetical protein